MCDFDNIGKFLNDFKMHIFVVVNFRALFDIVVRRLRCHYVVRLGSINVQPTISPLLIWVKMADTF